jgi:hypothetical protein
MIEQQAQRSIEPDNLRTIPTTTLTSALKDAADLPPRVGLLALTRSVRSINAVNFGAGS